jgi:glycosyltransferase involved in cell wall biosynthesis
VTCTGFLSREELVRAYNEARVFVLPSLFDSYGLVVNEAMTCGTPVIISGNVGSSVWLKRKAGLASELCDRISLFACLREILLNENLGTKMGKNGYNFVLPGSVARHLFSVSGNCRFVVLSH